MIFCDGVEQIYWINKISNNLSMKYMIDYEELKAKTYTITWKNST